MAGSEIFRKRFAELAGEASALDAAKKYFSHDFGSGHDVDQSGFIQWKVKALNLIVRACGEGSIHSRSFEDACKSGAYVTSHDQLTRASAVLLAAQDDYNSGLIVEMRSIISAELFESELDQARDLFANKYKSAAAVIAGVVLETALRQMCDKAGIPTGKLDKMNADLKKDGAYNTLVQKRITALADIRNSAAHGHPEDFTDADVTDMIDYVEKFLADHV